MRHVLMMVLFSMAIALIFGPMLSGCTQDNKREMSVRSSQFELEDIPESCSVQEDYKEVLREARLAVCGKYPQDCSGGINDRAISLILSRVKQSMRANNSNHRDCSVFVKDLKRALSDGNT